MPPLPPSGYILPLRDVWTSRENRFTTISNFNLSAHKHLIYNFSSLIYLFFITSLHFPFDLRIIWNNAVFFGTRSLVPRYEIFRWWAVLWVMRYFKCMGARCFKYAFSDAEMEGLLFVLSFYACCLSTILEEISDVDKDGGFTSMALFCMPCRTDVADLQGAVYLSEASSKGILMLFACARRGYYSVVYED